MRLYNTLTEKKEQIKKSKKPLRLFVCGPTVYDTPHIGNYRTFIAFDTFVRYIRSQGYIVTYLQNITDIDDKIITRAYKQAISWKSLARTYERVYHRGERLLGITAVSHYARATDYIPDIIAQVQTLIAKGHAYEIPHDGYYFDISTFSDYGKLSHRTVADAQDAVSRIDESGKKRNKGDFALWKYSKGGEPFWKTALGNGRPGWHIEDTAITQKHFGPQYDIHGGASELKFPHHEAEIAQQEAASGKKPFVRVWLHTGILVTEGKKMSKSLKNFITVDDFLSRYDARVFRYITLMHHYRSPIDYTDTLVQQAVHALDNIQHYVWKLGGIKDISQKTSIKHHQISSIVAKTEKEFHAALNDDFNTPLALAAIFSLIHASEKNFLSPKNAYRIQQSIITLLATLGITLSIQPTIPALIRKLTSQRERLRTCKQFMQADALRNHINTLGYTIEDTSSGVIVLPTKIFMK